MKKLFFLINLFLFCLVSCDNLLETDGNNGNEVILSASKTFASQTGESNQVYVIRDTFDLGGAEVTIGDNSILKFAGGCVTNGTVNFNNTKISGYGNFSNCSYKGKLNNDVVELGWFHFEDGGTYTWKTLTIDTHDYTKLQQIINCCKNGTQINVDKIYGIKNPVTIRNKIYLKGFDRSEGIYADRIVENMEYGFQNCGGIKSLFVVEAGGELSVQGLSFVGYTSLYMGNQLWEKCYGNGNLLPAPYALCGIDVKKGGRINEVHDSSFVAFTYGIRSDGGSIGYIRNSYFSLNRFGFWAKDTNDFECRGCRFNSNELNFHFFEKNLYYSGPQSNWEPLHETDADQIARMGGGLYLSNCKNAKILDSRFEFNYIQAIIDNGAKDVYIHNCIMDCATLCHVAVVNVGETPDASSPCTIDNFTLSSCTLARGARCDVQDAESVPGFGIFYISEQNNRGSILNFKNIIVSDRMEVDKRLLNRVKYEDVVFDIYNLSQKKGCVLNLEGNSFYSAAATKIFNAVPGSTGGFVINSRGNDYGDKILLSDTSSMLHYMER